MSNNYKLEGKIDLTPTTRLLEVLGRVEMSLPGCIYELIDNSLDAFDHNKGGNKIYINIPSSSAELNNESSSISILDTGPGMDKDTLEKALKAGYSGHNNSDKLGLFGVGFNISTAKLGNRTEVTSARADSKKKSFVTIDFRAMRQSGSYLTDYLEVDKDKSESNWSGTIIEIKELNVDRLKKLSKPAAIGNLTENIGRIYGKYLRETGTQIFVNNKECKPFRHCVWNGKRNRKYKNKPVSCMIKYNEVIDEAKYCNLCHVYVGKINNKCVQCQSSEFIVTKEKIVKGWIGLQRYLDPNDYGIDLIRNGRVIESFNKDFFEFKDPDRPNLLKNKGLEYPIDGRIGWGRIVGELEIDFMPVDFTKDRFDRYIEWNQLYEIIHGNSPLLPDTAKKFGYPENLTQLNTFYNAWRSWPSNAKNKAEKAEEFLFINNNGNVIVEGGKIPDYKTEFLNGDQEFDDDEKWFEDLVKNKTKGPSPGGDIDVDLGDDDEPDESDESDESDEPKDPLYEGMVKCEELSDTYSLRDFSNQINVIAFKSQLSDSRTLNRVKCGIEVKPEADTLYFRYWPNHKIFSENSQSPLDYLLNEVAYLLFSNASDKTLTNCPISYIERELRQKYAKFLIPDNSTIRDMADELLREIKDHIKDNLDHIGSIDSSLFDASKLEFEKFLKDCEELYQKDSNEIIQLLSKGDLINDMPFILVNHIFKENKKIFFNERFFKVPHTSKTNINLILNSLDDVAWISGKNTFTNDSLFIARYKKAAAALEVINACKYRE